MKKAYGKRLALLMGLLLAASGLFACGKGQTPAAGTTEASEEVTTGGDTQPISYRELLPVADYEEADVNILVMSGRSWQYIAEDTAADACARELISRNHQVEEHYHVYLNYTPTNKGWSGFHEQCRNDLYAEQAAFDITSPDYYYQCETAGYFADLATLDEIRLENPYWVDGWNRSSTVNGKIFTALSYLTLDAISSAQVLFMNNYFAEDLLIDVAALKQSVYNGSWTLDDMLTHMRLASLDNGDGEWTFEDRYGLSYNLWGGRAMLWSAGLALSEISEDGTISQTYTASRNVDIFQKPYQFFNSNPYSYYGGGAGSVESPVGAEALFFANRALFDTNKLGNATLISKNLDSFSLLPMPKYDKTQTDYVVSSSGCTVFGIMKTAKNLHMSATILEALSILSYEDVRPVYYEDSLKLHYSGDPDTARMLDFIMARFQIDFAFINSTNFGDPAARPFDLILDYNRNYVSEMKKLVDSFEGNLKAFRDAYSDAEPSED